MARVLPERQWVEIDDTHPVFASFFVVEDIYVPHPLVRVEPRYMAIFEDNDPGKRVMVLGNHNSDWRSTGNGPRRGCLRSIRPTTPTGSGSTTSSTASRTNAPFGPHARSGLPQPRWKDGTPPKAGREGGLAESGCGLRLVQHGRAVTPFRAAPLLSRARIHHGRLHAPRTSPRGQVLPRARPSPGHSGSRQGRGHEVRGRNGASSPPHLEKTLPSPEH